MILDFAALTIINQYVGLKVKIWGFLKVDLEISHYQSSIIFGDT